MLILKHFITKEGGVAYMTQHCILSLNVGFLKSQSLGIFFLTYVKRSAMVTDVGNLSISFSFLRVSISSLIFLTLASCLRVEYLVGPSMLYLESWKEFNHVIALWMDYRANGWKFDWDQAELKDFSLTGVFIHFFWEQESTCCLFCLSFRKFSWVFS